MPTLNIGSHKVKVGDDFLKLSPDEQSATVEEIASSLQPAKPERTLANTITDIPGDVANEARAGAAKVSDLSRRGEMGPIEGLMSLPRAVGGAVQAVASPIVGTAKAVGGNLMAQAEHAIGSVIAPETAKRDNLDQMYETAKGDVDLALSAARPKGMPVKAPVPGTDLVPAGQAPAIRITPTSEWQWQQPAPKQTPTAPPTIEELKASYREKEASPEVRGLEVKSKTLGQYADTARTTMNEAGFDDTNSKPVFDLLDKLNKAPAGSRVTGQNIISVRRALRKHAESTDPTTAAAAEEAISILDEFVPNISKRDVIKGDVDAYAKTMEAARGDYSAAKTAERLDKNTIKAELQAASTNSGMNVANKIRQNMARVAYDERQQRGMRADEVGAAEDIARGTVGQNALRRTGNVLGGGGGLGMLHGGSVGAAVGAAVGGPAGAAIGATAVPMAGHLLKAVANKMTIRQAEKLSQMIRSRAPLAKSVEKFEAAASNLQAGRTPQAISGFVLAARNLSTNLRSAGLNIAPADLIGALQSPGTSDAKDKQ